MGVTLHWSRLGTKKHKSTTSETEHSLPKLMRIFLTSHRKPDIIPQLSRLQKNLDIILRITDHLRMRLSTDILGAFKKDVTIISFHHIFILVFLFVVQSTKSTKTIASVKAFKKNIIRIQFPAILHTDHVWHISKKINDRRRCPYLEYL